MKTKSWLWPDRAISKTESRELREEHNALVNSHAELIDALRDLAKTAGLALGELTDQNTGWFYQLQAFTQKAEILIRKETEE